MAKLFFKMLRLLLTPFMLLWAWLATPKGIARQDDVQSRIDRECARLALYHFKTCPFCIKVRHAMAGLSLPVELRDAQHDAKHRADLLGGGGKIQTPCLRITGEQGNVQWMYESADIIAYLQQRFS
ncbi:MAG: glutathione S-transferase N-terminal domain-containing protein [Gallionella sp.]|jgi:glutaredoxin